MVRKEDDTDYIQNWINNSRVKVNNIKSPNLKGKRNKCVYYQEILWVIEQQLKIFV